MNFSDSGVLVTSRASPYALPLLAKWITVVEKYCTDVGTDAPFWHNERAHVGLLAAAAWLCGFVALEEFSQRKRHTERGRADLWVKVGEVEEFLEASRLGSRPGVSPNLSGELKKAVADAAKVKPDKTTTGKAGLVFWCPEVDAADRFAEKARELLCLCRKARPDALAWCFPATCRTARPGARSGPVWPGMMVLVSWVRCAQRKARSSR